MELLHNPLQYIMRHNTLPRSLAGSKKSLNDLNSMSPETTNQSNTVYVLGLVISLHTFELGPHPIPF